ncbi:transcription initiation factor IID, subunit [Ancylostoma duodenale]|uniref:Transcription initiation factor IID, subunit n=1 Tax=Ancylostoma duodenale TaxID=51022 RepID=A0A0C2FSV6_9BILA|nr:transcription initiation factor IID, subunit [Ancylostoma duodenale]
MAGSTGGNSDGTLLAYYRDIVRQMMFANGDLEDPIPACIELVLDIAKYQMVKALEDAWQHANAKQRKIITLEDVFILFKHHKFILKRLLQFAIAAECVNELKKAAPRTAKLDEEKEEESDMEEDEIATTSVPETNITRMKTVVDSMDLGETADQLLELLDSVYEERKKRIASFGSELTSEEYFRFTEARQATFRDDFKQKLKKWVFGDVPFSFSFHKKRFERIFTIVVCL